MIQGSELLKGLKHITVEPTCIYGDPSERLYVHLQASYRSPNMTPGQEEYNKAMSQVEIVVERLFGVIKTYFKFGFFKSQIKIV